VDQEAGGSSPPSCTTKLLLDIYYCPLEWLFLKTNEGTIANLSDTVRSYAHPDMQILLVLSS
jgi:hypothetical protein